MTMPMPQRHTGLTTHEWEYIYTYGDRNTTPVTLHIRFEHHIRTKDPFIYTIFIILKWHGFAGVRDTWSQLTRAESFMNYIFILNHGCALFVCALFVCLDDIFSVFVFCGICTHLKPSNRDNCISLTINTYMMALRFNCERWWDIVIQSFEKYPHFDQRTHISDLFILKLVESHMMGNHIECLSANTLELFKYILVYLNNIHPLGFQSIKRISILHYSHTKHPFIYIHTNSRVAMMSLAYVRWWSIAIHCNARHITIPMRWPLDECILHLRLIVHILQYTISVCGIIHKSLSMHSQFNDIVHHPPSLNIHIYIRTVVDFGLPMIELISPKRHRSPSKSCF